MRAPDKVQLSWLVMVITRNRIRTETAVGFLNTRSTRDRMTKSIGYKVKTEDYFLCGSI